MIIEHNFADDLLEQIEERLFDYQGKQGIRKIITPTIEKSERLDWMKNCQDYSLPVYSVGSSTRIQITKTYYDVLVHSWKQEHPELISNGAESKVQSMIESDSPDETIYYAIHDKISKLVFEYGKVLKWTKESNGLFGIEDEEKVLQIHLNKYHQIINSNHKQIEIMTGIHLNKVISDLVLEIYIRFINLRIELLNPQPISMDYRSNTTFTKIEWQGGQRDLCELFVELQNKNWIKEFEPGERSKMAQAICALFDLSGTKRSEDSDVVQSFYQILKGSYDPKTKNRVYDQVLRKKNERKFSLLKYNDRN